MDICPLPELMMEVYHAVKKDAFILQNIFIWCLGDLSPNYLSINCVRHMALFMYANAIPMTSRGISVRYHIFGSVWKPYNRA